jgi:hypothetical protein
MNPAAAQAMGRMRPLLLVLLLAVAAAPSALAAPLGLSVQLKPGGFVEVSVVDSAGQGGARAIELVAPDGRRFGALQTRRDQVFAHRGPTGTYFDTGGSRYEHHPLFGYYDARDPRCDPGFGANGAFARQGLFMPPLGCALHQTRPDALARTTARILLGNLDEFSRDWPQWRLRITYGDGGILEYPVPGLPYGS